MTKEMIIRQLSSLSYGNIVEARDMQAISEAIKMLNEQKTGYWNEHILFNKLKKQAILQYECSECRNSECLKTTYCSSCGAKMEGIS
jgi:hypothetical protein